MHAYGMYVGMWLRICAYSNFLVHDQIRNHFFGHIVRILLHIFMTRNIVSTLPSHVCDGLMKPYKSWRVYADLLPISSISRELNVDGFSPCRTEPLHFLHSRFETLPFTLTSSPHSHTHARTHTRAINSFCRAMRNLTCALLNNFNLQPVKGRQQASMIFVHRRCHWFPSCSRAHALYRPFGFWIVFCYTAWNDWVQLVAKAGNISWNSNDATWGIWSTLPPAGTPKVCFAIQRQPQTWMLLNCTTSHHDDGRDHGPLWTIVTAEQRLSGGLDAPWLAVSLRVSLLPLSCSFCLPKSVTSRFDFGTFNHDSAECQEHAAYTLKNLAHHDNAFKQARARPFPRPLLKFPASKHGFLPAFLDACLCSWILSVTYKPTITTSIFCSDDLGCKNVGGRCKEACSRNDAPPPWKHKLRSAGRLIQNSLLVKEFIFKFVHG